MCIKEERKQISLGDICDHGIMLCYLCVEFVALAKTNVVCKLFTFMLVK